MQEVKNGTGDIRENGNGNGCRDLFRQDIHDHEVGEDDEYPKA